ncbi:MAG: 6-carboxytetrahydropterin synthase QueD [Bacteroidia bacterium]|jgi:6-pyruvoyltetrahydropterin/6-carboxytetrahydropterin synthase|nr:6-carboxytetrahydropterin synthase QueD [Bacteroidia bacterium]
MLCITKKFRFEAAHALLNYNGPCKNIHGHSYELLVSVTGTKDPESGMVMDFKLLKSIVKEEFLDKIDHALIINTQQAASELYRTYTGKIFEMRSEPSAENMVELFAELITSKLPAYCKIYRIKLFETESSYVEWFNDELI